MNLDSLKLYHPLCGGRVPLASPTPPIGTAYRLTGQPVTALESRGRRFALTRSKECAARIFIILHICNISTILNNFIAHVRTHAKARARARARNYSNLLKFNCIYSKLQFGCGVIHV